MARQGDAGEGRRRVARPWRASPPSMPARSSACGGSAGGSAASMPCATSTSTSRTARGAPSSAPTARGRRRCSTSSRATCPQTSGTIEFLGQDIGAIPAPGRTRLGMGRTYQKSRLFLGLSVEDNLYLAVLGSRGGHQRLTRSRRSTARCASARASWPRAVGLESADREPRGLDLPRRAAPARGRHGPGDRAQAHAPRRARLGPLARRARRAHRPAARARQEHHADPHRARHGRRPARGAERHDDARRAQDRGGHARRDPRQRRSSTSSTSAGA